MNSFVFTVLFIFIDNEENVEDSTKRVDTGKTKGKKRRKTHKGISIFIYIYYELIFMIT